MLSRLRFTPLLLTLAAAPLCAQETTGTLAGTVATRSRQPIEGAAVHISSSNMLGERSAVTDHKGQYRIPLLPNGTYDVVVSAKGYMSSKGTFRVLAGQTSRADANMATEAEVKKIQEATVEVVGVVNQVDKTETVSATNFDMDSINQVMSNNLYAATYLAAGINTPGNTPSIRGGSFAGTKFLVNGLQVSDQSWGGDKGDTTIQDMIESVAVIQSPLNARYGNTDGGIVSMVTTKGSNEFTGTLRMKLNAFGLSNQFGNNAGQNSLYGNVGFGGLYGNYINMANDLPYPKNNGQNGGTYVPWPDNAMPTYDFTLRGPIWKDHITFAYGGTYTPQVSSTQSLTRLESNPAQPTDYAGTIFYLNDQTALRNADLFQQGQQVPSSTKQTYNQFVLFWQISENHQLEYNYTQNDQRQTNYGWFPIDASVPGNPYGTTTRMWDVGYKGIIGNAGVLEAKIGRVFRWSPQPQMTTPPIWNLYGPTVIPEPGSNPSTYVANSFLDYATYGATSASTNGYTQDHGSSTLDTTFNLNYEHLLDWHGNHLIDVGLEYANIDWNTAILHNYPPVNFSTSGQLATDYTQSQLPAGWTPAMVNGMYIVENYATALADLGGGPSTVAQYNAAAMAAAAGMPGYSPYSILGTRVWNVPNGQNLLPYVTLFQGNPSGLFSQPTTSYYANDLWTLNNNHSIMFGVRGDSMKVTDATGTLREYTRFTPRFEYKWDVFGNQSRVINFSYGQFNDRVPAGQFQNFVATRMPYEYTMYWTGTAPGNNPLVPYLVNQAQITNLANYGFLGSASGPGTYQMDPHWKAPVAVEYTLGYRRTYKNGMSLHITAIYKYWKDLYDEFPVYTSQSITSPVNPNSTVNVYPRVLQNDPQAVKTYKSVETEWIIPLSAKLNLQGNYTFARSMGNYAVMNMAPSQQDSPYGNFRNWFNQFYPQGSYNPVTLQAPEHTVNLWAVYDLSANKVKSSLAFRVYYLSGMPDVRTEPVQVGIPAIPGNPVGLNPTMNIEYSGGAQFTTQDTFTEALKYDLEVNVFKGLRLFTSIEILNPFNVRMAGWNGINSYDFGDPYGQPTYFAHGWRAQGDTSNAGVGASRNQPRAFTFEAGLKF